MSLEFNNIHHAYGGHAVLRGIHLEARAGEIACLLGSSGCGKTTLLRLAAGLLPVQSGTIHLDGTPMAHAQLHPPPERRPVGLVFQEGALFPHLNALQNVAFGLPRGGAANETARALLDQVGLGDFAKAYPHTLSGGQQQRVALARAIAPSPKVLLLDEPFASVDVVLRRALREETRRLLRARGGIALLVTHDPEEALELADQIVVIDAGRVIQAGPPQELYDAPASAGVAAMLGSSNTLVGERVQGGVKTAFGTWQEHAFAGRLPSSGSLDIVARTEALDIATGGNEAGRVEDIRPQGPCHRVSV
ncbi:MAG: ABC transporter ATP-binding protein, partial [Pseudomonadota bacterium]